ncbi:hypothetical protein V1527DRAFT_478931 [Lipomyces starkeyi]
MFLWSIVFELYLVADHQLGFLLLSTCSFIVIIWALGRRNDDRFRSVVVHCYCMNVIYLSGLQVFAIRIILNYAEVRLIRHCIVF